MCLVLFACDADPRYRLVVAANRDELHDRPAEPAHFWEDAPTVLAGRDIQAGGTWMGVTVSGRFAAVTNFRRGAIPARTGPSRGSLVSQFLLGDEPAGEYAARISKSGGEYDGFSLLAADSSSVAFYSNLGAGWSFVEPGVHGLSNALLDDPWPKVTGGRRRLAAVLAGEEDLVGPIFSILSDRLRASDGELPDTGVGIERERDLSPSFILNPVYGTRSSTILLLRTDGSFEYHERSYDRDGGVTGTRSYRMRPPEAGA